MKYLLVIAFLFPAAAYADDNSDFLQKAIASLQTQRNNAMDSLAGVEAKLAISNDQLVKANEKIKDLEKKLEQK